MDEGSRGFDSSILSSYNGSEGNSVRIDTCLSGSSQESD